MSFSGRVLGYGFPKIPKKENYWMIMEFLENVLISGEKGSLFHFIGLIE